ncbi:hypothetical protein JCGZ_12238 [Jatropha curcas]|uniref:Uncharacterized protein n=1 Tax=Jatropha curcas TaxID=180498 RepID=A0A067K6R3_JATCU|nr:hypothetical protein JCGZ_12238 [Jatropha curcas]
MANPTGKQALVLFLIVFMVLMIRSEARVHRKELDSRQLLREMGYTGSKLEYHRRISLLNSDIDRVSPGGPDPEHHSHSPGKAQCLTCIPI